MPTLSVPIRSMSTAGNPGTCALGMRGGGRQSHPTSTGAAIPVAAPVVVYENVMKNVIQFAHPRPDQGPMITNYAGRILALNPEKARTLQCGGFHLTPSPVSAVLPCPAPTVPTPTKSDK